jgi:MFS family permease
MFASKHARLTARPAVGEENGPVPGAERALWRRREFLLFWSGQSISGLGTTVSLVVVPLVAVVYLHASGFEVGALAAAEWAPWLLIGLPAGVWVDRSRPRLRALLLASVPVATAAGALTLGQLYGVAFGVGLATVVFQVAYQSFLPSLVPEVDLPEANAKLMGSESVAMLAGPGAGGGLVQVIKAPYALVADAASYVVSFLTLVVMRTPERRSVTDGPRESIRSAIVTGGRFVLHDPLLRTLTIAPAISNIFFGGFTAIEILFLVRSVGLSPGSVGVLVGIGSLGSLLGTLVARRLAGRYGTARALWVSSAVSTPFGLLIALTHRGAGLLWFIVGSWVCLAGILVYNVTISAFRQRYCPPDLLGRVVASMRFVLFGTIPLGALAAGALVTALGSRSAAFVLLAGNILSSVVLAASPLRHLRDLPAAPEAPPPLAPTAFPSADAGAP